VQADLIFQKLTGLEKPRSHSLMPTSSMQPEPRAQTAKTRQLSLDLSKFVKALVLVGAEVFGLSAPGNEAQNIEAIITNFLAALD